MEGIDRVVLFMDDLDEPSIIILELPHKVRRRLWGSVRLICRDLVGLLVSRTILLPFAFRARLESRMEGSVGRLTDSG